MGGAAWGRGRGSARPGWLPGGEGERERASGGEQAREAETRQGAKLGAVPGVFESPMAAAARRRRAELQDLGNQHAHCLFPFLSFSFRSSLSFTFLPSLSQVYLTGAGGFFLRDALAAARDTVGAAGAGWRGAGPGAIAGFSLGCGSGGGGGGRSSPARAAPELVGDLGSFLLLGSTFLSTARHCLHYFS